ncbi:MAG: alkane 1-monooxygenase [Burkholderiaceae bacterium]
MSENQLHQGANAFTARRYTIAVKKYGYLLFLLPATLPLQAWLGARLTGYWDVWAYLVPLVYFGMIPLLDAWIGQDPSNPTAEEEAALASDKFYRVLTFICLPVFLAVMLWGAWVMVNAPFSWVGQLGWIISMGCVGGVIAINTGHELIHKPTRSEQIAGGALLASVGYGTFKVEHIYGHHVDVATPQDNSTARLGENVYAFIARAFARNPRRAYTLERAARARRGQSTAWWQSELTLWYGVTLVLAALCYAIAGPLGLVYFAGQCVAAISLLEVINYVEHYGLARRQLANGRWEKVDPTHSWNSNYILTNLLLFQLQRHSDHHANAVRRYQTLRHFPQSPQLPAGYATMVVLAAIPWLWRRVMDPKVAVFEGNRPTLDAA